MRREKPERLEILRYPPPAGVSAPPHLAAAGYEEVMLRLVRDVADNAQRPGWKAQSFFRRYADKP